ncbi:hypothetical protein [Chitinimonas sp. PSY-7]|uniref:hypothetical protein n=1 Tax=Chitinimonas sp. PSY-7 TaxID=3459088 RepID=UPI0040400B15
MANAMGKNLLKDALSDPPGSRFKLYNQINIESFFCIKGQYMYPFFSNAVKVYRLPMLIASNV